MAITPLLKREKVAEAFKNLLISGIRRQISNLFGEVTPPSSDDVRLLLSVASRLALSDEPEDRHAAYEIATQAIELEVDSPQSVIAASETILSRLGNFPAAELTSIRYPTPNGRRYHPSALALETVGRRVENTFEIKDKSVLLTDFQRRLLDSLTRWNSVSFSAPTSAGKSFLLSLDIVRSQIKSPTATTIIVVPTRALIRQVMRDVIERFHTYGVTGVPVLCVPESVVRTDRASGAVYVLTQERLISFLNGEIPMPKVTLVVIDEAQEIGDSGRGILLQSAVERLLQHSPRAKILFSSPLRRNPGFLLNLFGRDEQGEFFVEHTSPVSQNVVAISPVKRQTRRAKFSLVRQDGILDIGEIELPFEYRSTKPQLLANFAFHLTQPGDSTIVYVNGPTEAESVARALFELHPESLIDPRLQELITFIEGNVHRSYSLAEFLKRGIAFHYGNMPDILRTTIEDLAREGIIRFICCTSTLLQGVNLPAKNIVIHKPQKGQGTPMETGDFWNLAGRAGRLMREYRGNVWCISPADWTNDPTKNPKLTELKAAFQTSVALESPKILESAVDRDRPAENADTLLADQSFAKVFVEFMTDGRKLTDSLYCNDANRITCQQIDDVCSALAREVGRPQEIFQKHNGVLPHRVEELGAFLHGQPDLESYVPLHPRQNRSLERLREIYHLLDRTCFKTGTQSYMYFAPLSWHWMIGETLSQLITNRIQFKNVPDDPKRISVAIRELLYDLDRVIRFRYVKYMRLYNDLLIAEIPLRGRDDLLPRVASIHVYLEHGSCDEALLHLMGFGLSRTSAIVMFGALGLARNADYEACRDAFQRVNLDRLRLTPLVRREVEMIRGR